MEIETNMMSTASSECACPAPPSSSNSHHDRILEDDLLTSTSPIHHMPGSEACNVRADGYVCMEDEPINVGPRTPHAQVTLHTSVSATPTATKINMKKSHKNQSTWQFWRRYNTMQMPKQQDSIHGEANVGRNVVASPKPRSLTIPDSNLSPPSCHPNKVSLTMHFPKLITTPSPPSRQRRISTPKNKKPASGAEDRQEHKRRKSSVSVDLYSQLPSSPSSATAATSHPFDVDDSHGETALVSTNSSIQQPSSSSSSCHPSAPSCNEAMKSASIAAQNDPAMGVIAEDDADGAATARYHVNLDHYVDNCATNTIGSSSSAVRHMVRSSSTITSPPSLASPMSSFSASPSPSPVASGMRCPPPSPETDEGFDLSMNNYDDSAWEVEPPARNAAAAAKAASPRRPSAPVERVPILSSWTRTTYFPHEDGLPRPVRFHLPMQATWTKMATCTRVGRKAVTLPGPILKEDDEQANDEKENDNGATGKNSNSHGKKAKAASAFPRSASMIAVPSAAGDPNPISTSTSPPPLAPLPPPKFSEFRSLVSGHGVGYLYFLRYLQRIYASESLLCWRALEDFLPMAAMEMQKENKEKESADEAEPEEQNVKDTIETEMDHGRPRRTSIAAAAGFSLVYLSLYNLYIKPGSKCEINISSGLRDQLKQDALAHEMKTRAAASVVAALSPSPTAPRDFPARVALRPIQTMPSPRSGSSVSNGKSPSPDASPVCEPHSLSGNTRRHVSVLSGRWLAEPEEKPKGINISAPIRPSSPSVISRQPDPKPGQINAKSHEQNRDRRHSSAPLPVDAIHAGNEGRNHDEMPHTRAPSHSVCQWVLDEICKDSEQVGQKAPHAMLTHAGSSAVTSATPSASPIPAMSPVSNSTVSSSSHSSQQTLSQRTYRHLVAVQKELEQLLTQDCLPRFKTSTLYAKLRLMGVTETDEDGVADEVMHDDKDTDARLSTTPSTDSKDAKPNKKRFTLRNKFFRKNDKPTTHASASRSKTMQAESFTHALSLKHANTQDGSNTKRARALTTLVTTQ